MAVELKELVGMTDGYVQSLKSAGNIRSVSALADATLTPELRTALADKSKIPYFLLYAFAKQADLLRCSGMTVQDAELLVRAGVRSAEDLQKADADKLEEFLIYQGLSAGLEEYQTLEWITGALSVDSGFQCDAADQRNRELFVSRVISDMSYSSAYGSDLSDIITELGIGIAQAQRQLDEASIGMQREILSDPVLSAYGLNATFYTIPEATFSLKMEYSYTSQGEKKISVVPMNASYNNVFKTERTEESTLNLRFVPVPAPEGVLERALVPKVTGMSLEGAAAALEEAGLSVSAVLMEGTAANGYETEVVQQSLDAGTQVMLSTCIKLGYRVGSAQKTAGSLVNLMEYRARDLEKKGGD